MPTAERQAIVRWEGDLRSGRGVIEPASGAFGPLPVSFPARLESRGDTTSPEELIAAAHASCYAMALTNTLTANGHQPQDLTVTAVCGLNRSEDGLKIQEIELRASANIPRISQEEFEELARRAEQRCPVSNALRGSVAIRLEARLGSGAETR